MSTSIIIILCLLLLLAYMFDITSPLTKIPSVILLLLMGWLLRQSTDFFEIAMPDLNPLLPVLGTIGLILIVLDGAIELQLDKSKTPLIIKSFLVALLPMLLLLLAIAWVFHYYTGIGYKIAMLNAVPLCVISSAIAIPSARNLANSVREFVVYESSLSDIFGVLLFNFLAVNDIITAASFGQFGWELLLVSVLSFVAVLGLSFLLSRITHHVTYTPIILLVILIYAVSKVYHMPGLLFILVFGLFLGNLDELKRFKWIEKFRPEKLDKEVAKFKEITIEATFLVRALFFIVFGFLMENSEIINPETFPWAVGIVLGVLLIRFIALSIARLPISPLLFISPRGLITVLLFLSISPEQAISIVNKSLIIQTIVISVGVMMLGTLFSSNPASTVEEAHSNL